MNSGCCTSSCQIANNGTVCRAAVDSQCDKEEVCTGGTASCPIDEYESDGAFSFFLSSLSCFSRSSSADGTVWDGQTGKSCGSGLSCASGVCTSRDLQCRNAGSSLNLTTACSVSAVRPSLPPLLLVLTPPPPHPSLLVEHRLLNRLFHPRQLPLLYHPRPDFPRWDELWNGREVREWEL
jgi:hypothetical protein